ncbi:hypothetical protein D3C81_1047620 [compost metagenome]
MLLYYAARLLLPGKGVKLRHGTFPLRRLPRHALAIGNPQFVHHQVQRPLVEHHMVEQQRKQLLIGGGIPQEGRAQRQLGGQIKAVIPRPGQQLTGITGRCFIGEIKPAVIQQVSGWHHLLIYLAVAVDKQRTQYAVAGHHVDKRLTQRGFIHRIKETDGEWQIEDFVVAEGLVDLPQGVLRQRQRRLNRLPLCLRGKLRCARFRHCLTFGIGRQSTGGRVAEQIVNVEFDAVQAE